MTVLAELGAPELRRVVTLYRDVLRAHQEELNLLNVYPVPDGDTGTNMALTLESVSAELVGAPDSMADVCKAVAHGSLMGARGNSGVILSQILRGLADTFRELTVAGGNDLSLGLRRASDAAYEAVMRPVEGTILTVVRAAAEAAERLGADLGAPSLLTVLERASEAARDAVLRTPELLPVLKEAGVVDAGGLGFALLLDAFLEVVDGRPMPAPETVNVPAAVERHLQGGNDDDDVASLRYEVMYLLEADEMTIPGFKDAWGSIGDSIVVVGGEGIWNCHIHTNQIGASIEAGIDAGKPVKIRVTDLFEQVEEEERWVLDHTTPSHPRGTAPVASHETGIVQVVAPADPTTTAVVAVGVGAGIRRLLQSLGVQAIVAGGQSMNPSTAQILEAVQACSAEAVIVIPNNKNIVPVARRVQELTDIRVEVVPTTAVLEGLAAMMSFDPDAQVDVNVVAMGEAVARMRSGEVTQAVKDSVVEIGRVTKGQWIALDDTGVCAATKTASDAAIALVDRLVDEDSELVTLLVGTEARGAETARLEEHLKLAHPQVEVEVHDGGQPLYPYLIGVE
jgi:DAK2 domain fusion protein YloV